MGIDHPTAKTRAKRQPHAFKVRNFIDGDETDETQHNNLVALQLEVNARIRDNRRVRVYDAMTETRLAHLEIEGAPR